jgi:GcrA cell cycle regulator
MGANEEPCPMSLLQREFDHSAQIKRTQETARRERKELITHGASHSAAWPPERVERLKSLFGAGLSCSRIANEIGVTRNAVIGKVNRLGLSRPKGLPARKSDGGERKLPPWRLKVISQHQLLARLPRAPLPRLEDIAIFDGRGCSLLELSVGKCRWPINEPGEDNFCFCGNAQLAGFPYCVGHARIAYKSPGRLRPIGP